MCLQLVSNEEKRRRFFAKGDRRRQIVSFNFEYKKIIANFETREEEPLGALTICVEFKLDT